MLGPWLDDPAAAASLQRWSDAIGLDLVSLGTTAAAAEITDTAVTQPLVVAAALLSYHYGREHGAPAAQLTAGHSVGELAAYAIAGVITTDEAVHLAAVRGRAMAQACAVEDTGMTALLGGDEVEVLARLEELGLYPANRNAVGQIVAAGSAAALAQLADNPPARARLRPLAVAGAFHTPYMESAQATFAAEAAKIAPRDPQLELLSNADGAPVTAGVDALAKLVAQMTRPVRWDLCCATMRQREVDTLAELVPAGALVGIAKRELKGATTVAIATPEDWKKLGG